MKKALMVLMALAMALSLSVTSMADEYEVAAEITITTSDTAQSMNAPEIPEGTLSVDIFGFDAGQMYAVYSAPDVKSLRGAGGKSKVSTNDWVQVFGRDGDWLMVQYDVKDAHYRIGYIAAKAIPSGMDVPALNLMNKAVVVTEDVDVTDDPLGSQGMLVSLPIGSHVTQLGTMGSWAYIEGVSSEKLFRGFVQRSVLSDANIVLSLEEAKQVLAGMWNVYAGDAGNADFLRFQENGTVYGQLTGDETEWNGQWAIARYDVARALYWNDPEFELTLTIAGETRTYGLRICWEPYGTNGADYALILSESSRSSGLVLCR